MAGLRLLLVDEFGNVRTLSDNVYVGPEQPTNPDISLWIDTTNNPPVAKYRAGSEYIAMNNSGSIAVTSVANIPTTSKLVVATISGDESLSVGDMVPGQEIHLIVTGNGNITIPSDDVHVNMTDDVISVDGYAEINIISDGIKKYIRSI